MNMHTSELVLEKLGEAEYMEKFPLAEELTPWVVDLEPGDAYAQLHRPVILGTYCERKAERCAGGQAVHPAVLVASRGESRRVHLGALTLADRGRPH